MTTGPTGSAATPSPPSPNRIFSFELLLAAVLFVALAATTIFGALASNRHYAATLRAEHELRATIAAELGLDRGAIDRGYAAYMTTCISCHGERGESLPNLGKDLAHSEFVAGQSNSQMLMFLKLGRNTWDPKNTTGIAMPPKGGNPMFNDSHLKDITAYIRYLQAVAKGSP